MPTTGRPPRDHAVSLYFHLPFCRQKCGYCHFFVLPDREELKEALALGLRTEWSRLSPTLKDKSVVSIYFGGGTPSLYGPKRIATLLEMVHHSVDVDEECEITLEANPEDITLSLMADYRAAGINRVSIGVQTLDTQLLTLLTRQHNAQKAKDALFATYEAGITNISMDLMYDIPGQTLTSWASTLNAVQSLPITHLSLYNLTIEPHTAFYKKREELETKRPPEESSRQMYELAVKQLAACGLKQYEISAFARNDRVAIHNSGYWQGRPFWGLGPSAYSDWEGSRLRNIAHLNKYLSALNKGELAHDYTETLPPQARRRELLVIGLRLMKGLNLSTFERTHGPLDTDTHHVLKQLISDALLDQDGDTLHLTQRGCLFYDTVASELI